MQIKHSNGSTMYWKWINSSNQKNMINFLLAFGFVQYSLNDCWFPLESFMCDINP